MFRVLTIVNPIDRVEGGSQRESERLVKTKIKFPKVEKLKLSFMNLVFAT